MDNPLPKIRFIKLGEAGRWEDFCIREGCLRLGYQSPFHQASLKGDWDQVKAFWLNARNNDKGAATRDVNQIRDFYEASENDIWITFHKKRMYWCRAVGEVEELPEDGSRIRRVLGQWACTDETGSPLSVENLDGRVTKVQAFRGTICAVSMQDYLLRKLRGEVAPEIEEVEQTLTTLRTQVCELIAGLWWKDFELLTDLIFSKAGWQRFSVLGETEKDIDIDAYAPTTQRRAFIQIKSQTNRHEAEKYIDTFRSYDDFDEMFFVYHTSTEDLSDLACKDSNIHLWGIQDIAALVINSGLLSWLINKRR
jgi:hypothetical protein